MTTVDFSTSVPSEALKRLQKVEPDSGFTAENLPLFLGLVREDVLRVQDPFMYGSRIGVMPGKNYSEGRKPEVDAAVAELMAVKEDTP